MGERVVTVIGGSVSNVDQSSSGMEGVVTVIGRPCGPITGGGRWVVAVIGWLASSAPIINRDGDMGTVIDRPRSRMDQSLMGVEDWLL